MKKLDGEIYSTIEKHKINQLKGLTEEENITLHQNEVGFIFEFSLKLVYVLHFISLQLSKVLLSQVSVTKNKN